MKNFALLLVFGAVLAAEAAPILRLGDYEVKQMPVGFSLADRQTRYGPLAMTDQEAYLLLILAEAHGPLSTADVRHRLAREGVDLADPPALAGELNAKADKVLRRRLIMRNGDLLTIDGRPRRVPGVEFRTVHDGVIWNENWIDLTDNQARFLSVAQHGATYAQLEEAGWPSRRARELVTRINKRVGGDLLTAEYAVGVRLGCAESLRPETKELALFD